MEMAPASHIPAHTSIATVAPFRAWRGSRFRVAGGPTGATTELVGLAPTEACILAASTEAGKQKCKNQSQYKGLLGYTDEINRFQPTSLACSALISYW